MSVELVLATANQHKRQELVSLLAELDVTIRTMDEFEGIPPIVEDGDTCRANAEKKARIVSQHTGKLALADDTGLEVDALGGRPGVYAARYAGEHATYADNCQKMLNELEGVPTSQRTARFLTVAAIAEPSSPVESVEGVLEGTIAETAAGTEGFGYDPIFVVPELGKTLAELPLEQKNQISHRGKALAKAKEVLKRKLTTSQNVGA
ncbi:MAG: XTP/dITP diphosphatase [Nitrospirota bacterium]|nr:XTP/dITP diphosphatase [Nitrospirota bacterium]